VEHYRCYQSRPATVSCANRWKSPEQSSSGVKIMGWIASQEDPQIDRSVTPDNMLRSSSGGDNIIP